MAIAHRGSWLGLPDFGITERFTGNRTSQGGSDIRPNVPVRAYSSPQMSVAPRQSTAPILGANTGFTPTTSTALPSSPTGGGSAQPAGQDILRNDVNRQVEDFGAIIDRDYETAIGGLNMSEQDLRSQAGSAESSIRSSFAPVKTALGEEQATRESGITSQEQQASSQQKSALQQARDLFRQTQQSNIAQLSGLGISSSSVSEALAERLGVETARRIAGVTGSTDEVLRNLGQERARIQQFYKTKLTEVESQMQSQIGNIQQQLLSGVNQINQARNLAATDKANRRAELLSNAQTQIAQLQASAQQFQQSLDQWQAQRSSALQQAQQFVVTPTDFSQLNNALQGVQGITAAGGQLQGYQSQVNIQPTGKFSIGLNAPKQDDDPYAAALRAAGV